MNSSSEGRAFCPCLTDVLANARSRWQRKNRVLLEKGGVLLGLKTSDFGWKRGVLSSKIREKGGGGSNLGTSVVYRGVGNGTASRKYYTAPERGYYYAADDQVPTGAWPAKDAVCTTKLDFFLAFFLDILGFFFLGGGLSMSGWRHWKRSIRCRWHMCNLMCQWTFKAISMTLVQYYV